MNISFKKPKYDYSKSLVDRAPKRRVAIEDKKRKTLKGGTISQECVKGRHSDCAVGVCQCKFTGCMCTFNPAYSMAKP